MAKPLEKRVFLCLTLGLAKYMTSTQQYPYPPELLYAQHHLSLAMLTSYPATITGFFKLCKKPLEDWWPGGPPAKVDKRLALLEPDGDLGQQVIEYLLTAYDLPEDITLRGIQEILDSELMGIICGKLRKTADYDPVGAQREYVAIRSYVISHPWTTSEQLRRELRGLRHILPQEVGDLYQESNALGTELRYPGPGQPEACYWNCSVCGPLYQRNGRLGSIKPGACEKRCPGSQTWQPLDVEDNTRVLKRGVHLFTHIPGFTEMELYRWLLDEVQPTRPTLQQVELWPGVDKYDLRLTLRGKVWAVDVKDYKGPFSLGEYIKKDQRSPEQKDPVWHEWFYVYPTYHELQRPDYGECVRQAAEGMPTNVTILSAEQFSRRVLASL
jgi:hypothetical protein